MNEHEEMSEEAKQQYEELQAFQKEVAFALNKQEKRADTKTLLYEIQKQINDFDYRTNLAEAELKKEMEDDIAQLKQVFEQEF